LWWDTEVHGEQEFLPHQYDMINKLLKPKGGGGTEINCVTDYINKHQINSEAIIVFTDGHFFNKPEWNISTPTLFVSTESEEYIPDNCKVVKQELEPDMVSG
jgi:predicted metal-dependent peptidase